MHWLNSQIMQSFDDATKFKKLLETATFSYRNIKARRISGAMRGMPGADLDQIAYILITSKGFKTCVYYNRK